MKLIPEYKRALHMFSVQAMVLAGAIQGTWAVLPPEMQATVPDSWLRVATVVLLVLGVLGRLIHQPKVSK